MAEPLDSWDKARDFALTLPGTASKGGRMESVIIAENGQFFVFEGRENATSFAVQIDLGTIDNDFGGWAKAQATHFADGGVFDQLYRSTQ